MDKKSEYRKIYKESFGDSDEFTEMFFDKVCREKEIMMLDIDGILASALLLKRFMMNFHGEIIPTGYICAAATARKMRGRGYMSDLILETLKKSFENGDYFVSLIPAERSLYPFYDRFGFTTVFYIQEERYTSAHKFRDGEGFFSFIYSATDDKVRKAFNLLSSLRSGTLLFDNDDYDIIVEDNRLDNGEIVSAYNPETDSIDAVAVAVFDSERIIVRDILYVSDIAREAVLSEVKRRFGEYPVTVIARPDDCANVRIEARGMGRIVNLFSVLETIAATSPKLRAAIRVNDRFLPQNNHIYVVDNGKVVINDGFAGRLDLDVTQEVLTSIIFSAPKVGMIFNLPAFRPFISLMLE